MSSQSDFIVVIPARYASTRLPAKPLVDLAGKPMIQRVVDQAAQSSATRVVVATDHQDIFDCCEQKGIDVLMTSDEHETGTDRLAEVVEKLKLADDAIVVNVQGDEPLIPPSVVDQVAANLAKASEASIATLAESISDLDSIMNPNVVKVVFDKQGLAHYFSRAPIPWARNEFGAESPRVPDDATYYRHIGIYAYRAGFLRRFASMAPAMIEKTECLEQLRALYYGERIHVAEAIETPPAGIDTQEDVIRVRALLQESSQ